MLRKKKISKSLIIACLILLIGITFVLTSYAQADDRGQSITQEQYIDIMNRVLDSIITNCQNQPQHKINFSANLFFAHEVCIKNMPLETLKKCVDALKEAGVNRIDINMGLFPWLDNHQETIQKYDNLIEYIRHHNLQIAINAFYGPMYHRVNSFEEWRNMALQIYPEIAKRYTPEIFIVIHEPTTMASRMGFEVSPEEWGEFVKETARVVKAVSQKTRCGAGVLADPVFIQSEQKCFDKFLSIDELEIITLDIYNIRSFDAANKMIREARRQGKKVYIEETWRSPYYVPQAGKTETLDNISAMGIGNEAFQTLDVKWLEAMSLYASVWGLEAITPFWIQTFFKYVKEGGNALSQGYNLQVIEAINNEERTKTFEAFKEIIQKRGLAQTAIKPEIKLGKNNNYSSRLVKSIKIIQEDGGRVAWSPKDDLIAFDRRGEDGYYDVWIMKSDGSGQRCLTCDNPNVPQKHNGQPAWHPSGEYIVFQAQNPSLAGFPNIFQKIEKAFTGPGSGVNNNIWLMDKCAKQFWQLTNIPERKAVLHPHFSHDGKKLIWSEMIDRNIKPSGRWVIKIADIIINHSNVRLENILILNPGDMQFYETHGFFPDDKIILFSATKDGQYKNLDIYSYNLITTELIALTNTSLSEWDEHAHFSPDGRNIIWMSSMEIPQQIKQYEVLADYWIMDSNGKNKKRLTYFNNPSSKEYIPGGVTAADFAWSPNGGKIIAYLVLRIKNELGKKVIIELSEASGGNVKN
ncbi:hypothetical protein KKC91_09025 [bacterium]|nr:hypothetical protein [bacterium]